MATTLVPTPFHSQRAVEFAQSFNGDDTYFVYVGDHIANASDTVASQVVAAPRLTTSIYDNMIEGIQLSSSDVAVMVPRNVWASNTAYNQYSDAADSLCHVVVESGSTYHVYKCLDNNDDANSTSAPSGTDSSPITTADGYVWKYIYSVSKTIYDSFKTSGWMPFIANTTNQAAAVPGSIEVIDIVEGGVGYNNYFEGTFRAGDKVTNTSYKLVETASSINDFYNGCIIKVTDPDSPVVGEYRTITDYVVSGGSKTITISSAFSSDPNATDTYDIYPAVNVVATNGDANVCVARAVINSMQSNTVSEIEILESGSYHRSATANVVYDASVSVTTAAELTPIISPASGHGGDPVNELGGTAVAMMTTFDPNDSDVPANNDFRMIGVIANPRFDNVVVTASGNAFTVSEQVIQYQNVATFSANVSLSSTTLSGNTGSTFVSSLAPGDSVAVANATHVKVATIASVSNNTTATTEVSVGAIAGTLTLVRLTGEGTVAASNTTAITLSGATPSIAADQWIYGATSQRKRPTTAVSFNGRSSSDRFIQATRLTGTFDADQFDPDELVEGADGTGRVHSILDNGDDTFTVFVTNVTGSFALETITGADSGSTFDVTAKYDGDLAVDRGQLIYAENVVPVTRASNKTETIKLVLEL